jgi:hypothetical protein
MKARAHVRSEFRRDLDRTNEVPTPAPEIHKANIHFQFNNYLLTKTTFASFRTVESYGVQLLLIFVSRDGPFSAPSHLFQIPHFVDHSFQSVNLSSGTT